ncbi:hypothetical protein G6F50_008457 [Rhizopus delemar]|uniref:SWIRM domain-containing protein n=1 Tax=Rhizopus delemar TaxID=936053 RepID=A0A9P6YYR7_9FUNG|nr:hypothetical protein G6F50_008457 [Rhizopus delemar]
MPLIPISPPITPKTYHEKYDDEIDPILLDRRLSRHHRTKSIPSRSLPSYTRYSFVMNTFTPLLQPNLIQRLSVKKQKTDTIYDTLDLNQPDHQCIQPEWMPNMDAFERYPHVRAIWKGKRTWNRWVIDDCLLGTPLNIQSMPYYELLHPGEVNIASTLRLSPEQYLKCRRSLILAAEQFDKLNVKFRKSDAQKCVRIDVNKTSALWCVFNALGWFKPKQI